jgi:hypothetical protein
MDTTLDMISASSLKYQRLRTTASHVPEDALSIGPGPQSIVKASGRVKIPGLSIPSVIRLASKRFFCL